MSENKQKSVITDYTYKPENTNKKSTPMEIKNSSKQPIKK